MVGKNGQGKTNFLEAIAVLSHGMGFHTRNLAQLISWNTMLTPSSAWSDSVAPRGAWSQHSFFSIQGDHLEVIALPNHQKAFKIDGEKVPLSKYFGTLRIVLFSPEDLNMIHLTPQVRRRYLNMMISQVDHDYFCHLRDYQAVVKQRNQLLKRISEKKASPAELEFWDLKAAEHGIALRKKRREILDFLNADLSAKYEGISASSCRLRIQWATPWTDDLLTELRSTRQKDIERGTTGAGPHHDDFILELDHHLMHESASRGECRSAVLALKLTEKKLIEERTQDSPLILFDDVFSELDPGRQKNFLSLCSSDQVIITTTHLDFEVGNGTVWKVVQGSILS